jgi:hypothetical protein
MLNENITKAQQTVDLLVSDLRGALSHSMHLDRVPSGRDKALQAWLGKVFEEARQLQMDLLELGGE